MILALFLFLLVGWAQSQAPVTLPPETTSDLFTINPCSFADYVWTVPASASNRFFFEIEFQPGTESQQIYHVTLYSDSSLNCPLMDCNAQTGVPCKVGIACGAKKQQYYIRVLSLSTVQAGQGSYRFEPSTRDFPVPIVLPIFENEDVDFADEFKFTVTSPNPNDPLTKYHFFTFTVPPSNDRRRIRIETTGAVVEHYLQKDRLPYPDQFGCVDNRVAGAATALSSCELVVGGTYFLIVERTSNFEIKAYYERPVLKDLGTAKQFEKMFKVDDEMFFRYSAFKSPAETTFISVVDNVAGGSVLQGVYYKDLPFQDCATFGECDTAVSCHVTVHPCITQGKTADVWWIGVKVLTMDDEKIPVTFTISVVQVPNSPRLLPTLGSLADFTEQGQFKQFKIETNTLTPGDWLHIEFYIDASHNVDVDITDASLYLRDRAYAGDNGVTCFGYVDPHTCIAVETQNGRTDVKSCSIQLDPCALTKYPNGIWVGVHAGSLQLANNYHWFQDTLHFTLKTRVWNPNKIPGLLADPIDVANDVVYVGQTNVYRVNSFLGKLSVGISAADTNYVLDDSIPLVRMEIIIGSAIEGPSCDCWLENVFHSHDVLSTTDYEYAFEDPCKEYEEGIFIAVTGLGTPPTVITEYNYFERQYTLSVKKVPVAHPESIPLQEGLAHLVRNELTDAIIYKLEFPRQDLTNKILVVKGRAHRTSQFTFSLRSNLACGAQDIEHCTVDEINEGYCTIVKDCFFPSATDSTDYYVEVTNPGVLPANTIALDVYELWFEILDKPVTALQSGATVIDTLQTNIHKQYSIQVAAGDVGTKNLLVELYFDAGHSEYDNVPAGQQYHIHLFVNTPSSPRTPGSHADYNCYCSQVSKSDKRKIIYHVNSCNLISGAYRFSVFTKQPVYDTHQAKFTLTATLQPALITNPQFRLNFPLDFKLYLGQIVTFVFDLPPSMFSLGTDIDRTLEIKLHNNQPGDDVEGFLTKTITGSTSSLCSCNTPPVVDTCTTANECTLKRDYCALTQGTYYFVVTGTSVPPENPLDPISFTIFISRTNTVEQRAILPIAIATKENCDNRVRVSGSVRLFEYQHFSFPLPNQPVEIYVEDVEGGSVVVHLQKDNLATTGCRLPINPPPCDESSIECAIPITCASVATHLSVETLNPTNADPVKFNISACFNPIGETSLRLFSTTTPPSTPGQTQTGGTHIYKLNGGLNNLNVGQFPVITIELLNAAGSFSNVEFTTGSCSSCPIGFLRSTGNCGTNCKLEIDWCELPSNFRTADWFVEVTGNGNYDLDVSYRILSANVVSLTRNVTTQLPIPAGGWAAARWNPSPTEIPPVTDALSRVRIEVPTIDSEVESYWYQPPGVTGVPNCFEPTFASHTTAVEFAIGTGCCAGVVDQYIYFHNKKTTDVTFEITPRVILLSNHQLIAWTNNQAQSDVIVPPAGADNFLKEARINYPGRSHPQGHLYIRITSPETASTTVYYNKNAPAGPTTCTIPPCCFSNSETSDTVNTNQPIIKRRFCDVDLNANDLWFGLENGATGPHTVNIRAWNVDPRPLTLNVASTFTLADKDIYYQHYIDINTKAFIHKEIVFTVRVTEGSANAFYQHQVPAGDVDPCLTNTDSSPLLTTSNEWEKVVSSCGFASGRYFIGVHGVDDNVIVQINVTTRDTNTPVLIPSPPAAALQVTDPTMKDFFLVSPPTLTPNTVMRVKVHGLGSNQPLDGEGHPDGWLWYSESNSACTPLKTAYCNDDQNDCSFIIYPCLLTPSTTYHFEVPAAPTYDINGTVFPVPINDIPMGTTTKDVVFPHDLKFYTVRVTPSALKPGQTLSIVVDDISCGDVEVWINKDSSAGKYCNINPATIKPCKGDSTKPCVLKTLQPCDFLDSDDYAVTFHITVRGLEAGFQGSAARFSIGSHITGGVTYRPIETNEIHTLWAVRETVVPPTTTCPPYLTPITYPSCCDAAAIPPTAPTFKPEHVYWHYHIEGTHFLENFNEIELELATGVDSAIIYLSTEVPHYPGMCNGPQPTNIWSQSCTATTATDRKCHITLHYDPDDPDHITLPEATQRHCRLRHRRDIFLWIDPASVVPATLPGEVSQQRVPVAHIINRRAHYSVIGIGFIEQPKYMQFALSNFESQYIVVEHPDADVIENNLNYRLSVHIFDVLEGGTVELYESWDGCKDNTETPVIRCESAGRCLNKDHPDLLQECNAVPDCLCEHIVYPCDPEFSGERKSYFRLTGHTTSIVTGLVRFKFVEVEEALSSQCVNVWQRHHRYYHLNEVTLGVEQVYKFTLNYHPSVSGSGETGSAILAVYSGRMAERNTCQQDGGANWFCEATGAAGCVDRYYRHELPAHASVSGSDVSTGLTFYTFHAVAQTVPVCTLANRVPFTSPTVGTGPCPSVTPCNWYKFVPVQASNYMLIEYVGTGTFYMHRGHVTYMWGERSFTCTGSCYWIIACNYLKDKDFYFHVPDDAHTITVHALTVTPIPFTVGPAVIVNAPPRTLAVYRLDTGGAEDDPTKDLKIHYSGAGSTVDVWVTRGNIGDRTCDLGLIPQAITTDVSGTTIPTCNIHRTADSFFVHFFLHTTASCSQNAFSLRAFYEYSDRLIASPQPTVTASGRNRFRFNVGPLTENDIVYVQIKDIVGGTVSHTVWKANHLSTTPQTTTNFPCSGCNVAGAHPAISWHDHCWHCGNSIYDTVYVDVTAAPTVGSSVKYTASAIKTSWTDLSSTPIAVTFSKTVGVNGLPGNHAFFRFTSDPLSGSALEVSVANSGSTGVKIEIFGAECGRRNAPWTTLYCFDGEVCHFPITKFRGNHGSYWQEGFLTHNLAGQQYRVVVTGNFAAFSIRHVSGPGVCREATATDAPFCTGHLPGTSVYNPFGTIPRKDAYAERRFELFETRFSCEAHCKCRKLSQPCLESLRKFACSESLPQCSDKGTAIRPNVRLCTEVQVNCGRLFREVGFPELDCFNDFYIASPTLWVTPDRKEDTYPPIAGGPDTVGGAPAGTGPAPPPPPTSNPTVIATESPTDIGTEFATEGSTEGSTEDSTGQSTAATTVATTNPSATTNAGGATAVNTGSNNANNNPGALSGGAIAGIVIAVILLIAVIAAAVVYFVVLGGPNGAGGGDYHEMS